MNKCEIGKFIIERRDALRISQGRLAELSGVSVHTLFANSSPTDISRPVADSLLSDEAKGRYLALFRDRLRAIAQ